MERLAKQAQSQPHLSPALSPNNHRNLYSSLMEIQKVSITHDQALLSDQNKERPIKSHLNFKQNLQSFIKTYIPKNNRKYQLYGKKIICWHQYRQHLIVEICSTQNNCQFLNQTYMKVTEKTSNDINKQKCIILVHYQYPYHINLHIDISITLKHPFPHIHHFIIAMTTKEVLMMVLDAGNAMDEMYSETASRLKLALECIEITLQQKIYYNPTHEVGFGIFGDADHNEDDDNFLELHPISKPSSQLLMKMHQMCEAKLDNEKPGGDIFRAIRYSIYLLNSTKYKKAKKRIFIFTCGKGETIYNEGTIKALAIQIKASQIKLNVIPINFMEGYVIQENQVETDIPDANQLINAQLLMDLKSEAEDNVQIFPDQIAIELYKRFRKRQVNPTAIFKGQFQIAPDLGINVQTYKFIRRDRLKSLQKYDVNQPFVPQISKEKEITTKVNYIIQGDETNTQIEKENQMNAYSYGPHLVPISSILQSQAKFFEDRNLRLLGFVPKGQVARAALMGEVELMVPQKSNLASRKLFTAIVFAMISTNRYAIARYVPRNAKAGVIPRLVVLIPYRSIDREGLYLIDLPTVQDVRDYPFNSLKPSTDKQHELVREMIEKMSLHKRNDDTDIEQLKMQNTFNPTHQYFYQTVFYRVIHNEGDIPVLNPEISKYLKPELRIYQETQQLCKDIKKQFKFARKELAKDKAAKRQALLWKDALQNQMPVLEDKSMVSSQTGDDLKPHKVFNFQQDDNQNFDPTNPLISFNRMLSNNKVDLVSKALKSMVEFITSKLKEAVTDDIINFLVQCASTMRRGCDEQQEEAFWDDWLQRGQQNLPKKLYNKIIQEGFGFLKRSNDILYSTTKLSLQHIGEQQLLELD